MFLNKKAGLVWLSASLLICTFAFWGLGAQPLYEWDEARHGQNALEMLRNGDFINYFYRGQHDTWNAKPPLLIWSVVASYKLFGLSEYALRFPSAVVAIITVGATTLLARKLAGTAVMWLTFAILLTSKGIFGFHTGRTGDMDAMLMAFGMSAVLCWQIFLSERKTTFALFAAVFWGLAFYSKGMAALMFVAGAGLLTIFSKPRVKFSILAAAGAVALLFPISWFLLVKQFGIVSPSSMLEGKSGTSLDVMIFYDVWERLTGNIEGHGNSSSYSFVLKQWDVYFSPWIYLLYGIVLFGAWQHLRKKLPLSSESALPELSRWVLAYLAPIIVLLTFARSKLPWYIAPTIPFMSILLAALVHDFLLPRRYGRHIAALVLIVAAGRHLKDYIFVRNIPELERISEVSEQIRISSCVAKRSTFNQAEVLKLSWLNPTIKIMENSSENDCPVVLD